MADPKMTEEERQSKEDERASRKLSLIEQGIDAERVSAISTVAGPGQMTGIKFNDARDMMEFAKLMAVSGTWVPPYLRGNVGGNLAICAVANRLLMDPFIIANWSYETEKDKVKTVAFMAGFYNAVILARAPVKDRIHFEIVGEGDERYCKVWFTLKGEREPRVYNSETLGKLRPPRNEGGKVKGSPLWDRKPGVALIYDSVRDVARIYFPDTIAGLYTVEEMQDVAGDELDTPENARVVSPSDTTLRERLTPLAGGEGFNATKDKINEAINAARADSINQDEQDAPKNGRKKRSGSTTIDETAAQDSTVQTEQKTS